MSLFPLPRQTRESDVIVGDGRSIYGPFAFKVWDAGDVVVEVKRGAGEYLPEAAAATKVANETFDDFLITFASPLTSVDRAIVRSSRLHSRSVDVVRGGTINSRALDRELSVQSTILQELWRDIGRFVSGLRTERADRKAADDALLVAVQAEADARSARDDELVVFINAVDAGRIADRSVAREYSDAILALVEQLRAGFSNAVSGTTARYPIARPANPAGFSMAVALTTAITLCSSLGGGTIDLPAGTYDFPAKMAEIAAKSNIVFQGATGGTVLRSTVPANVPAEGDGVFAVLNGCSRLTFRDITFDLGGIETAAINTAAVIAIGGADITFDNCRVVGGKRVGLFANGTDRFVVRGCHFRRLGGHHSAYQNEAVISSASFRGPKGVQVVDCVMEGWGTLLSGNDMLVANNDISDWGYGGGVTVNADASTNRPIVINNRCHDSSGLDINATYALGIECWAPYAEIAGNKIWNCAGSGIGVGGPRSLVRGNTCWDNGREEPLSFGIALTAQPGWARADFCVFDGNLCFDNGGGAQEWGYGELVEASFAFVGTTLKNNQMSGPAGDYRFSPFTTQRSFEGYTLHGEATHDFPAVAPGSNQSFAVTVSGARVGDHCLASLSLPQALLNVDAYVHSPNQVFVVVSNPTGAAVDLASGKVFVEVRQRMPTPVAA